MFHRPLTEVVYWPSALPEAMLAGADGWLRTSLDRLGVGYRLSTWARLDQHSPDELAQADLLFVGGGNTFRLLDQVRSAGLVESAREFVAAGGDYYGGSAGAVLACDDIGVADGHDLNEPGLKDLTALGILPGVSVLPHFTAAQLSTSLERVKSAGVPLIGLPETAGLRVIDHTYTVVGADPVHLITATGSRSVEPGATFSGG